MYYYDLKYFEFGYKQRIVVPYNTATKSLSCNTTPIIGIGELCIFYSFRFKLGWFFKHIFEPSNWVYYDGYICGVNLNELKPLSPDTFGYQTKVELDINSLNANDAITAIKGVRETLNLD